MIINNVNKNKNFVNIISINENDAQKITDVFLQVSKNPVVPGLYISPQYDYQLLNDDLKKNINKKENINYLNSINENIQQLQGKKGQNKIINSKIFNQNAINEIIDDLNDNNNFIKDTNKKSYFDFIFPLRILKESTGSDEDFLQYVMQPLFLIIRIFDISKKVDISATISKKNDKNNISFSSNDIKIDEMIIDNNVGKYEIFWLTKKDNNIIFYSDIIMYSIFKSNNIDNQLYSNAYRQKLGLTENEQNHLGINISYTDNILKFSADNDFYIRNLVNTSDVNKGYQRLSTKFLINNFFKSASNEGHHINFINFNPTIISNNLFSNDVYSNAQDILNSINNNSNTPYDNQIRDITQLYYELISAKESRLSRTVIKENESKIKAWNEKCLLSSPDNNLYSNYFELTNASSDLFPIAYSTAGMLGYYVLAKEDYILKMYEGLDVGKKEHQINLNELYKYIVKNIIKLDVKLL